MAQVFDGADRPLHLERSPDVQPGPGEVLVRIDLATVCGSDLHTISGLRPERTPCVLGHEGVGTVVALGDPLGDPLGHPPGTVMAELTGAVGHPDLRIGDRITWTVAASCGRCPACTRYGLPQKCEQLFKYGHAPLDDGSGLNGTYASHLVLRRGTHLVRVPDELDDRVVAPANCALATVVHALSALPEVPRTVLVQGAGLLGLYACALLAERGAEVVLCTDIDDRRLALVEPFGGVPIDGRDPAALAIALAQHAPGGVDVAIEVAGVRELIPEGVASLRVGGWYLLVGLVHPDSTLDLTAETLIRRCITLRGVHNYTPADLDEAIAFLARDHARRPYADLVGEILPLADLDRAVLLAAERRWPRVGVAPGDRVDCLR